MKRFAVLLLCASCIDGGALTAKSTPAEIRYFAPETATTSEAPATPAVRARLHVGRLTSSANLRTHIVHRESPVELGTYESLRWTENPEEFVRRSLEHALFEEHRPLEQAMSGPAPTLDIDLVAFEEVHDHDRRGGRVQLRYELHDEHTVISSGVVTIERGATDARIESVVMAISAAMNAAVSQVATTMARLLLPS